MFFKSEISNTIINGNLIHRVEIVNNEDENFTPCYDIVAYTLHRGIVMWRKYTKKDAVHCMSHFLSLLNT